MKKTLFISDLDGTLLDNSGRLSEYTIKTINALTSKGVYFTVATARTAVTVKSILKGLSLSVPAVLMNGVCIFDTVRGQYENCKYIKNSSFNNFVSLVSHDKKISPFVYTLKNGELTAYYENLFSDNARRFAWERREKYGKRFIHIPSFSEIDAEYAVYFTIREKYEYLIDYYNALKSDKEIYATLYKDTYSQDMYYLEICSANASKAGGVRYLREHYGFDEVCAFGDNANDLPMFAESNRSYAVANATQQLKDAADEIIQQNTQDAVAKKLKELIGEIK